jgi:sugar/nucleoside kinase (ribokinase family)
MSSGFVGKIGRDEAGQFLHDDLLREGVDITHMRKGAGPTGSVIALVEKNGRRTMLSFRGVNVAFAPDEIPRDYIADSKWLHVSGYSLTHKPQSDAALIAIKQAKKAGVRVSLDPSPHIHLAQRAVVDKVLALADVLFPNGAEIRYLSGRTSLRDAGKSLLRKGASIVATKLGREGCMVMTNEEELRVSSFKVKSVDTTGAGDAYDAGFVVAQLLGWNPERSGEFGNAVGALKTMRIGAREGLPRMDEVEKLMRHEHK